MKTSLAPMPVHSMDNVDGGGDSGSWWWRPHAIHTPTTRHSTLEPRLEANLQKQSAFFRRWNPRHLKIFSDRIEYGSMTREGVFTQKQGTKSPIFMHTFLLSFRGVGDTDFVLRVHEGKNKAIKEKTFRCASASNQRTLLAVLEEISGAAHRAAAQLAEAIELREPGSIQQALDASAPYGIGSRKAERLIQLTLIQQHRGQEVTGVCCWSSVRSNSHSVSVFRLKANATFWTALC